MTTRGVTMVELVVALALIALLAAISGVALNSLRAPRPDAWHQQVARARAHAVSIGVAVKVPADSTHAALLFLPDGRAVGRGADPLTGEVSRGAP